MLALSQGEIEGLERGYPRIEDVLPLSPLQEGLLFHALYDAPARDVYTRCSWCWRWTGRSMSRRCRRRAGSVRVMPACAPCFRA